MSANGGGTVVGALTVTRCSTRLLVPLTGKNRVRAWRRAIEERGDANHQFGWSSRRRPGKLRRRDHVFFAAANDADGCAIRIHDPVLLDAGVEVELPLLRVVAATRRAGEHFDHEDRNRRVIPVPARRVTLGANHEIRLDFRSFEPKHRTRSIDHPEAMLSDERHQDRIAGGRESS